MGRPIYESELNDPDFQWLISSFQASRPNYLLVQSGNTPVVFFESGDEAAPSAALMLGHAVGAEEQD